MAEQVRYRIVTGTVTELEKEINDLARNGWRVVSSAHGEDAQRIVPILEMRTVTSQP